MKLKRKLMALLLVFCMMIATVGCGGNGDGGSSAAGNDGKATEAAGAEKNDPKAPEAAASAEVQVPGDLSMAYDETVTVHIVGSESASTDYPEGDSLANNIWIRTLKDQFNIELVFDWISSEYDTKLNLAIANGNLPDVFRIGESQLRDLVEADLVWDLSEVFDQYASDTLKRLKEENESIFDLTRMGTDPNAMYGVPGLSSGPLATINYVWIRQDWKNELGLKDPETMDDLVNICKAFMENYGAYGIYDDKNLSGLKMMAPAWEAYPNTWVTQDDGTIGYGGVQEEMKNAVTTWAQWYKDGILNADFVSANSEQTKEAAVSGRVGVEPYYCWWGADVGVNLFDYAGEEALFRPYAIPSATGNEVLYPISFNNAGFNVVSKKYEHPEALIKVLNYYLYIMTDASQDGVPQDVLEAYTVGNMANICPLRISNTRGTYSIWSQVKEAMETGDTSVLGSVTAVEVYNSTKTVEESGLTHDTLNAYYQFGAPFSAFSVGAKIVDAGNLLENRLWGSAPDEVTQYGSTLDSILLEGYTKIIIGEEDPDYFDTLVEEWMKAGGAEVTKAMNETFNK